MSVTNMDASTWSWSPVLGALICGLWEKIMIIPSYYCVTG